jgi:ferrous iron transport protein B
MTPLRKLGKVFTCCQGPETPLACRLRKVAIVGSPNVGKSVIFNALTGARVSVSNYPGTTVEVSRGHMNFPGESVEVIDTPGMYSLSPVTEEERVSRRLLLGESPDIVIHVIDAKHLSRMLPFTLQLLEGGFRLILVLNIMDEATRLGMTIDRDRLEKELGIPVIPAVSVSGKGLEELRSRLEEALTGPPLLAAGPACDWGFGKGEDRLAGPAEGYAPVLPPALQQGGEAICNLLRGDYGISHWVASQLLLNEDSEILEAAQSREGERFPLIQSIIRETRTQLSHPPGYIIWLARQTAAERLTRLASTPPTGETGRSQRLLDQLMMRPLTGLPILFLFLYLGLYLFVGKLGAGVIVDGLQKVYARFLETPLTALVERLIPYPIWQDLLVHDYGLITLGLRYAVIIILPVVASFFLVFAIIEDSGYLPRLALLLDRFFKAIGLSGRAVIPIVLGFGCGTMATVVTRVLETRRERIIATLLLALAIPCSAQLGIIFALLSGTHFGLLIWGLVVGLVFLLVGGLSSRLLKGAPPSFYIEVPPLRWPKIGNIFSKTYARMECYFAEVLPLFMLASLLVWLGRYIVIFGSSIFDWALRLLRPAVVALGLPPQASEAFLFGFLRRDYGAAGLYDLHSRGLLQGNQMLVAMVTLTLFLPCIAQALVMQKERGLRTTLAIIAFVVPFAWLAGFLLYHLLNAFGVKV